MTDTKRLKIDFQNFNRRARKEWGHYEYIIASEPQARGAWHIHALLIFDGQAPFMDAGKVADCWRQGFVKVKKLEDVDNVGAYLTAYLGDLDLDEARAENMIVNNLDVKEVEVDEDGEKVKKKFIKGARLRMYPPGMHIFRWSKGIKKPITEYISNAKHKKIVRQLGKATYYRAIKLHFNNEQANVITYSYYNSKRK